MNQKLSEINMSDNKEKEEPKYLTKHEITVLWDYWKREFISYENSEVIEIMKKLTKIATNELDKQGS